MSDRPLGLKQLQEIGYRAILGYPVDCDPLIDMDFEQVLGYLEANPGIDTSHHHAIRYGIRKVVERISHLARENSKKLENIFYNVPRIVRVRLPPDTTGVTVDENSNSSSEDDISDEINPLNQNLQVLAESTLHKAFQDDADKPNVETSSLNIDTINVEPSFLPILPLHGGPAAKLTPQGAGTSSSTIRPYDDAGPLTPSIIRYDAPLHAPLTPIAFPEGQHSIEVNKPIDDIIEITANIEIAEEEIPTSHIYLENDNADAGIVTGRGEINENPNHFLVDFGETEDLETRITLAAQLFHPEVPMEIDEPDQQQPLTRVAKKTSANARRRSRTSFPQPTRRTTKPFKMIPENWEPELLKENENTEEWSYVPYTYFPLACATFLVAIKHEKVKEISMPNADLVRNPRILIKPNEILDSVPNAHLISSPQIPVMPNADLVSDPQHLGIPNVIPAYDPQYLEMSTNNPVVNHPQIIRVEVHAPPVEMETSHPEHPVLVQLEPIMEPLEFTVTHREAIIEQREQSVPSLAHISGNNSTNLQQPEFITHYEPIIERCERSVPSHAHIPGNISSNLQQPESGEQFRWSNLESKDYLDVIAEIADKSSDLLSTSLLRRDTTMQVKDAFAACLDLHNEKFFRMNKENDPTFTGVALLPD